jgi:hypothetical protein
VTVRAWAVDDLCPPESNTESTADSHGFAPPSVVQEVPHPQGRRAGYSFSWRGGFILILFVAAPAGLIALGLVLKNNAGGGDSSRTVGSTTGTRGPPTTVVSSTPPTMAPTLAVD